MLKEFAFLEDLKVSFFIKKISFIIQILFANLFLVFKLNNVLIILMHLGNFERNVNIIDREFFMDKSYTIQ